MLHAVGMPHQYTGCCAAAAARVTREPCNLQPPTAQPIHSRYQLLPIMVTLQDFEMGWGYEPEQDVLLDEVTGQKIIII